MKNLLITFSLISSLLISQSVMAQDETNTSAKSRQIETIVVTPKPEVANFEVFSTEITKSAIDSAMQIVSDNLSSSVSKGSATLISTAAAISAAL